MIVTRIPFTTKRLSFCCCPFFFFLAFIYLLLVSIIDYFGPLFFSSDVECFRIAIELYVYYLNEYLTSVLYSYKGCVVGTGPCHLDGGIPRDIT